MPIVISHKLIRHAFTGALAVALSSPVAASACACGCGAFEVGPNMLTAMDMRPVLSVEYDFMDQNRNWSGTSSAPSSDNDDKQIRTHFVTIGTHYPLGENWSVSAQIPIWNRLFRTDDGSGVERYDHTALGDVRLTVSYAGLSSDMSTSIVAGVKFPTGSISLTGLDRDTQIGSGSSDLLVGIVHAGTLSDDGDWSWYGQLMWNKPVLKAAGYMPGSEFDAAAGVFYGGFSAGQTVQLKPYFQFVGSARIKDSGPDSDSPNSGYRRILASPGIEIAVGAWNLYGDVAFPVYQTVNGNQLVAHQQYKFAMTYAL